MTGKVDWKLAWNVAAVYLGWFAAVWGAAWARPYLGPIVVACLLVIHLVLMRDVWRREAVVVAAAAVLGYSLDSLLVLAGAIGFHAEDDLIAPTTLWMVSLWANFATMLNLSLRRLAGNRRAAAASGLLGGPMSYWAVERLGALRFPEGPAWGLGLVACLWALALPLLVGLNDRLRSRMRHDSGGDGEVGR